MKSRYFLLAAAATVLSSCETYNAMRMDPTQRPQASLDTTELPEIAPATEMVRAQTPARSLPNEAPRSAPRSSQQRRDLGNFLRPDTLTIPTQADLQETATSTETPTGTPGLTVPSR